MGQDSISRREAREALARGLRNAGLVDSFSDPNAGGSEADTLLGYLEEAGLELIEGPGNEVELELKLTCAAMPEQYEAFIDGRQVGYLRLRHGTFRAHYPDHIGAPVYIAETLGDGMFADSEREDQIRAALVAVLRADGVKDPAPVFELPERPDDEDWDLTSSFIEELGQRQARRGRSGRHS